MANNGAAPARMERLLVGEPLHVGGYTLEPVARLSGWSGEKIAASGGGGGAWLTLSPLEVRVRDSSDVQQTIAITDPQSPTMRAVLAMALSAAGMGIAMLVVGRFWRTR